MKFYLLLLINFSLAFSDNLFFELGSKNEVCFAEEVIEETILILQHEIYREDLKELNYKHDIDTEDSTIPLLFIHIYLENTNFQDNSDNTIDQIPKLESYEGFKSKGKNFFVVPETNIYRICVIGNKYSKIFKIMKKIKISLSINQNDNITNIPHEDLPNNENFKQLDRITNRINDSLNDVVKKQVFIEKIEEEFSQFQNNNNHIIMLMSIIELILILIIFGVSYYKLTSYYKMQKY